MTEDLQSAKMGKADSKLSRMYVLVGIIGT